MSDFQCYIMFKKVLEKPQKPPYQVVFLFYKYVGGNSPKRGKDCNIFII